MPTPIPIVSLTNLVSFIISIIITMRLYVASKTSQNLYVRYFFWCFFSLTLFFFAIATPGLLSSNGKFLGFINIASHPFVVIAAIFFTLIPIQLFEWEKLKISYLILGLLLAVGTTAIRALGYGPLFPVQRGNFEFWLRPDNVYVATSWILTGIFVFASVLFASIVFIVYGVRHTEDAYVRRRSFILGIGAFLLGVTATINYILGVTPQILPYLISSFLALFSLTLLAFGIFYRRTQTQ